MYLLNIFKYQSHITLLFVLLCLYQAALASTDFSLEGLDGKWHKFSEYTGNGKWTVVNVWGPGCPPCEEEMPELVLFHDAHKNNDASVIGIAIDFPSYRYANKNRVSEFIDDYLVSFPVLLADASVTEKMGAGVLRGLPSTYMYSPEGSLVGYQVGGINRDIIEKFIKRYESRKIPDDTNKK